MNRGPAWPHQELCWEGPILTKPGERRAAGLSQKGGVKR